MDKLNLVLKFKLAGDPDLRVRGVGRIKVDGRGGLVLYDAQTGADEIIDLRTLQAFCIHKVNCAQTDVPAVAFA
jgi:hypothetical protein